MEMAYMSEQAVATPSQTSAATPDAGWYPDPQGQGLRWWDGSAWTEHTHNEAPAAAASAATSTPASASPAAAGAPATSNAVATTGAGTKSDVGAPKKTSVSFVNDHAVAIFIVLAAILAVVVALQVV